MKSIMKPLLTVCLLLIAAGCAPTGKLLHGGGDVLRIGGEDAAISGFVLPVKETFESEHSGVTISVVRSWPGSELLDLEKGEVDAVVTMQPLEDLLRVAAQEKVQIDPSTLRSIDIGKSDTVVFLNRTNNIKKLTRKQLKGIFSGKITNWKQLHGSNRKIVVVWNSEAAADDSFIKEILGDEKFAPKQMVVHSFEEVRSLVSETPGAIGIAPSGFVTARVNVPSSPKVTSQVRVITKGKPSANVRNLTDILKEMELLE